MWSISFILHSTARSASSRIMIQLDDNTSYFLQRHCPLWFETQSEVIISWNNENNRATVAPKLEHSFTVIISKSLSKHLIIHIINSPFNFSIQNSPQNSDKVQFWFESAERCITKHLKNTKLYPIGWRHVCSISVWEVWRHFCHQKLKVCLTARILYFNLRSLT